MENWHFTRSAPCPRFESCKTLLEYRRFLHPKPIRGDSAMDWRGPARASRSGRCNERAECRLVSISRDARDGQETTDIAFAEFHATRSRQAVPPLSKRRQETLWPSTKTS
jgi:hypothetical protein